MKLWLYTALSFVAIDRATTLLKKRELMMEQGVVLLMFNHLYHI